MNTKTLIELIHQGQKRMTGEPYTTHLYAVRDILRNEGITDKNTLYAALLHDAMEDNENITKKYLAMYFGEKIAQIVEVVSKKRAWLTSYCRTKGHIDEIEFSWRAHPEAVLIKMADRLHNLQTLHGLPLEKQIRKLKESKEYLMPLFQKFHQENHFKDIGKYTKSLLEKLEMEIENNDQRLFLFL